MKIKFDIYKITKMNINFDNLVNSDKFIVVGEEEDCYLTHELEEGKICLVEGLDIQQSSYRYPKEYMEVIPRYVAEFDIPNKYLSDQFLNYIEDRDIYKKLEDRSKNDNGVRHSLDDVTKMIDERLDSK